MNAHEVPILVVLEPLAAIHTVVTIVLVQKGMLTVTRNVKVRLESVCICVVVGKN